MISLHHLVSSSSFPPPYFLISFFIHSSIFPQFDPSFTLFLLSTPFSVIIPHFFPFISLFIYEFLWGKELVKNPRPHIYILLAETTSVDYGFVLSICLLILIILGNNLLTEWAMVLNLA